jgi:uncharacterized phage-associated protein
MTEEVDGIINLCKYKNTKKKVYTASQIASYIIYKANMYGDLVTNLKLQKLLYLARLFYSRDNYELLFDDNVEMCRYGPVFMSVYNKYEAFLYSPIITSEIDEKELSFLDDETAKILDKFLLSYMNRSATELEHLIKCFK